MQEIEWEYITIPVPKAPGVFDHEFSFWIPELPLGNKSGKAKVVELSSGKQVAQTYKDAGSRAFQNRVRNYFHNAAYEQGKLLDYPFDGFCRVFLYLFYPKPKGWHPTMLPESSKIPDNDNVAKSICDGLNASRLICLKKPNADGKKRQKMAYFGPYDDDKQIKTHVLDKHYSDCPGARVVIWFYRRLPREPLPGKRTIKAKALQAELESGAGSIGAQNNPDHRTYRQFLARYG